MSPKKRWIENIVVAMILCLIAYGMWEILGPASPRPTAEQQKLYDQGEYGRHGP